MIGVDLPTVRAAAVAIARWAVDDDRGRAIGDPVHEWVTEGRRSQYERALAAGAAWAQRMPAGYSSCGDLAHWMLMLLGVRHERIVNRGDDGGLVGWAVGANLSRLTKSRWYVPASENGLPEVGDILHVSAPEHVCVLLDQVSRDQWVTADYGQPHGQRRVCQLRDTATGLQVRGRMLVGWVSLGLVATSGGLEESALVPDSFQGGVLDDNPYDEELAVPEGVVG
jgi:hypothetical protein